MHPVAAHLDGPIGVQPPPGELVRRGSHRVLHEVAGEAESAGVVDRAAGRGDYLDELLDRVAHPDLSEQPEGRFVDLAAFGLGEWGVVPAG